MYRSVILAFLRRTSFSTWGGSTACFLFGRLKIRDQECSSYSRDTYSLALDVRPELFSKAASGHEIDLCLKDDPPDSLPSCPTIGSGSDSRPMTERHKWTFRQRFRRGAFGWRSQPAIKRVKEAVSEIKATRRRDPELAANSPTDPRTLSRAARDLAETDPDFAVGAGLAALRWLLAGHGYEITSADVHTALGHTLRAAKRAGRSDETREMILSMIEKAGGADGFVGGVLARRLAGRPLQRTDLPSGDLLDVLARELRGRRGS